MSDLKTEESSIPLLSVADWDDTSSHSRPASPALGPHGSAGARTYLRQHIWAASGVAALLLLLPVGLFLLLQHTSDLELVPFRKGPPEFVCAAPSTTFKVADVRASILLISTDPTDSSPTALDEWSACTLFVRLSPTRPTLPLRRFVVWHGTRTASCRFSVRAETSSSPGRPVHQRPRPPLSRSAHAARRYPVGGSRCPRSLCETLNTFFS
jgi:hypothetical protein